MPQWTQLAPDLFVWRAAGNTYALRDGERALLIDGGSPECRAALAALGVRAVDAVWLTHAHRDQCRGAPEVSAAGTPLHLPAGARQHVEPASRLDFSLPSPGELRYPWPFKPPQPMPGARFDLTAGTRCPWGPWDLELFAAPGHSDHQLAILAEGPGGPALFCGDALYAAGKVHEGFHLETDHYTGAGARLAADTLCALRNLRAARLCPSHGPVTDEDVWAAFDLTITRLRRLADLKDTCLPGRPAVPRLVRPRPETFLQVSPRLWLWSNSYFLVSADGPVLMVDVERELPDSFFAQFRAALGDRPIEVVLVSHLHCDHVMGIASLRRRYPLACWALDRIVPAIEAPYSLARPWLHRCPTKVDRPLADGETVRWREYELTARWFPAQTDFHAAYELTIDGHRAIFSGDNFYPAQQWGGTGGLSGFNGGRPEYWRRSARQVLAYEPDWILASHMQPFVYRRADFETIVAWSHEVEALMRELSPAGDLRRHHDPHLCEARPYVQAASDSMRVSVRLANSRERTVTARVAPLAPADIGVVGGAQTATLAADAEHTFVWDLTAAADWRGVAMVTFDVTVDGEPWGELAECYVRG
jgi:glyoxylase-like metal-dependent hydrolase (beta-lactamase superfamily II)